ncbi:DegT/DnrJ/EryC1/StrS family aminotransferase [Leptospira noguchii]|uniref:lipid II:glycine glycyltransferase FemX n=1 Tax=Leptospira noguchii TaxID=28182 RepID=UPI001147586F|nr:DegT/DnrJ/EryC1/StrS family aminotransferase [Leptospira noguchii]TQE83103.1 glycosyltransferase [Leptospira noguchii]UOG29232.1 DegT/DnrJ/EryC1/StrS family aminotransferase [Leptospira noguchii]UOG46341.1 DegT/DnrJ/EryC1/StrS family aminotransferase [Leptospira noguchii]UOG54037.1 DegT/DnrJ/EryC1/StrS family aminotransferase [Leptospira noguchii]
MYLLAPLPSWRSLFSILSFKNINQKSNSKIWMNSSSDIPLWFSKSAWSLLAVAVWRKIHSDQKDVIFWIPDYFCNSSLFLLRSWGVKFVFYPIQRNREPDYKACKELLKSNSIDVFLLVHYFGKPSDSNRAFEFCKEKNVILIEDAAHVLKPIKGIGEKGDFILYSPHKHLPIPDGAVLIVRNSGPSNISWDVRDEDQVNKILKNHYQEVGNTKLLGTKWLLKRLLQKLGFKNRRNLNTFFSKDVFQNTASYPFFSLIAKKMLNGLLPQLNGIAKQKIRNQKVWDEVLSNRYELCIDRKSENWTPYLSEYSFDGIDKTELMFKTLLKDEFPVSTWPDLPPEIHDKVQYHLNAIELRNSRLFLSIHSNLSIGTMIKNQKVSQDTKKGFLKLNVEWDFITRDEWEELFRKIENSNLLQSWVYGESKEICEGWKIRRGIFTFESQNIAIVQVLEKSILGIFKLYRINRGPLFLGKVDSKIKELVFHELSKFGNLLKGSILLFNPELVLDGKSLVLMKKKGFYESKFSIWTSAFIDLTKDLNFLRQNLDSKWRNMLTNSEKNELTLEVGSSNFLFHWMLNKYEELTLNKNFSGISKSMLLQIEKEQNTFLILRAIYQNEFVAGICIATHGASATYLIGWNGELGRKLRANHFLLWNSVVQLKQMGYLSFDLGGIDQEKTPGIAEFKLGMNGDKYELSGEFWKL